MNFLNFRFGHGQAGSQRKNRLRQVKSSVKIPHLEFFEGELEKRELLATTSFSSGMLSINLNAAGEILRDCPIHSGRLKVGGGQRLDDNVSSGV